jgi:hypothetical protein
MESPMSPEMIDAAIIQLNSMLDNMPNIPAYVKEDGKNFTEALDKWAGEMRTKRDAERMAGQTAKQVE